MDCDGDGDADDGVCDGEAEGFGVPVAVARSGLGVLPGLVTKGAGEDDALPLPGTALGALAEDPETPPPSARVAAWARCGPPAVMTAMIPAVSATAVTGVDLQRNRNAR